MKTKILENTIHLDVLKSLHSVKTDTACMESLGDTFMDIMGNIDNWFSFFNDLIDDSIQNITLLMARVEMVTFDGRRIHPMDVITMMTQENIKAIPEEERKLYASILKSIPTDIPLTVEDFRMGTYLEAMSEVGFLLEDMTHTVMSGSTDVSLFKKSMGSIKGAYLTELRGNETMEADMSDFTEGYDNFIDAFHNARDINSRLNKKEWELKTIKNNLMDMRKMNSEMKTRTHKLSNIIKKKYTSGKLSTREYVDILDAYHSIFKDISKMHSKTRKVLMYRKDIRISTNKVLIEFGRMYTNPLTPLSISAGKRRSN